MEATAEWCPIEDLRVYAGWLGDAMRVAGWSTPYPQELARR